MVIICFVWKVAHRKRNATHHRAKRPANLPDFVIHHHIQIMKHDKDYTTVELQGKAVPESSLNVLLCDNRDFSR